MRNQIFLLISLLLFVFASVLADKVYMWKDKDGVVHFGDRPAYINTRKKEIQVNHKVDQDAIRRNKSRSNSLKAYSKQQKEVARKNRLEAIKDKGRRKKCTKAGNMHKSYTQARFLYSKNSQGQRVILPSEKRNSAINEVKNYMAKYCN